MKEFCTPASLEANHLLQEGKFRDSNKVQWLQIFLWDVPDEVD